MHLIQEMYAECKDEEGTVWIQRFCENLGEHLLFVAEHALSGAEDTSPRTHAQHGVAGAYAFDVIGYLGKYLLSDELYAASRSFRQSAALCIGLWGDAHHVDPRTGRVGFGDPKLERRALDESYGNLVSRGYTLVDRHGNANHRLSLFVRDVAFFVYQTNHVSAAKLHANVTSRFPYPVIDDERRLETLLTKFISKAPMAQAQEMHQPRP